jgi:hypothetical protein
MTKCQECIQGPTGIEGHQGLFVHTMSGGPMQFKCRTCGALWMRQGSQKNPGWTDAVGNEAGSTVPQAAMKSVSNTFTQWSDRAAHERVVPVPT